MAKRITVVTGSPRKGGNTDIMVKHFVKGAEEAGNTVTVVDAGRSKIGGCLGCEYCFSHEGECVQKDDMQEFYPVLRQTDVLVYATPVYCFTFSAQIKAFMDRMFCGIGKPFGIKETCLLTVFEDKDATIVEPMIATYKALTAYSGMKDIGVVAQHGTYEKGAIEGKPGLAQAYELGKSIS